MIFIHNKFEEKSQKYIEIERPRAHTHKHAYSFEFVHCELSSAHFS